MTEGTLVAAKFLGISLVLLLLVIANTLYIGDKFTAECEKLGGTAVYDSRQYVCLGGKK